ncbi:MAG: sigma 54-interacting transcriptional regulator [Desulfuromonadaceae bacterium]
MFTKDKRRCYQREKIRLPLKIFRADPQASPVRAWLLNASPGGLAVELSDRIRFSQDEPVHINLFFSKEHFFKLGSGIIRHIRIQDGCQTMGIELVEIASFLSGTMMLGVTPQILEIKSLLPQICSHDLTILIRGETGTGKNVLAHLIHEFCRDKEHPFIRVNCPSIPDNLFESELFGHEKGAFTDAKSSAPGYFRLANQGTILLDEISEIQPHLQAKLLRVIEEKQFMAVGGQKLVKVHANIIATTNLDLEKAVEQGRFRRDLYFRLCEMPIYLPPLRERQEDVVLLAHYFLIYYCQQYDKPFLALTDSEIETLKNHSWPGNIRELENQMKQTALLGKFIAPKGASLPLLASNDICSKNLSLATELIEKGTTLPELTKTLTMQIERTLICSTLSVCKNNKTRAAHRLGISYRTLLRKLELHNLDADVNSSSDDPASLS